MKVNANKKAVLGVWDMDQTQTRLGALILFIQEVFILSHITRARRIDIAFIKGTHHMTKSFEFGFLGNMTEFIPNLHAVFFFTSHASFKQFLRDTGDRYHIWPDHQQDLSATSYAESTRFIQKQFDSIGKPLVLPATAHSRAGAQKWFGKNTPQKLPVIVHLKNNPLEPGSNANSDSWLSFFRMSTTETLPVKFILIGNDAYDPRFEECENVLLTRNMGGGLFLDLSLVQTCFLFMGMASGPCNMALFSGVPSLVWKHPDHHAEHMKREFQSGESFPFLNRHQKFMMAFDSLENLTDEFKVLFRRLDPRAWHLRGI